MQSLTAFCTMHDNAPCWHNFAKNQSEVLHAIYESHGLVHDATPTSCAGCSPSKYATEVGSLCHLKCHSMSL